MKEIILTKGKIASVDDEDYNALMHYKWAAIFDGNNWYAYMSMGSRGNQKRIMMHRVLLQLTDPSIVCDHIDGNGLNNQKYNLRKCTNDLNSRNRRVKRINTTGFKGVLFKPKHRAFQASINVKGKFFFGGHFKTAIDAAKRYNELAVQHHGEFARLNTIP